MHIRFSILALGLWLVGAAAPAEAQDASEFILRLNRMENQVRTMSGQIEQLQFENRQLKEQARKFQEDVEFRFQERSGAPRSAAPAPAAVPSGPTTTPGSPPAPPRPARRGDAFDPDTNPSLPGAPRPLGSTQPSPPLAGEQRSAAGPAAPPLPRGAIDPGPAGREAPRDGIASIIDDDASMDFEPLDLDVTRRSGAPVPPAAPPAAPRSAPSIAATATADPRADYDASYAYFLQRQYEQAEMGFRRFLQSYPRDRLVPDATFWLGESYLQRNRPREAAEQFLKVSTDHGRSAKAPDAMLKLGVALNALGAKDQACATFAELERKFPQTTPALKQGVEREQKRAKCAA